MTEYASSVSEKAGLPPGTLVHVGAVHHTDTRVTLIAYSRENVVEQVIESAEQLATTRFEQHQVVWINIEGLADVRLIESIGKQFNIHPLILEDVLNTHQRPKVEEYDDCVFMVAKAIYQQGDELDIGYEQISIILFDRFIFTFTEQQWDLFSQTKDRIRVAKGGIRQQGADYLAYVILDTIIDRYFSLQDAFDELVDRLEEELLTDLSRKTMVRIQRFKRELIGIRRVVSPQRDMLSALLHTDTPYIQDKTFIYFRDVYDHVLRVSEAMESYREIMTGLLDIYVSSVSNKMNEIMKVLTVFASIFIPLTFLTGIYGMNFDFMPELKWKWSYPILWAVFIAIPVGLLILFKKKKWL